MARITGAIDERRRIIIPVGVQPTQITVGSVEPTYTAPCSDISELRGLIDTGAQRTCITRSTARRLGLRPRGKVRIGGVSGIETHNEYHFVLSAFYDDDGLRGIYNFEQVNGVDFADNADFEILIGMDVIMRGELTVRPNGTFLWKLF